MDYQIGSPPFTNHVKKETWRHTLLFSFQSLGVVYGRLSIAPLYVFGTISQKDIKSNATPHELFSLVFWTLTITSLLKYAFIVLNTEDNGEGGIFALYSLLCRHDGVGLLPNDTDEVMDSEMRSNSNQQAESLAKRAIRNSKSSHYFILFMALLGSCLMVGDGILTRAISVLSASTGLERSLADISNSFKFSESKRAFVSKSIKYVPVPAACSILITLFTLQRYGTHKIGFIFAPIIIIWLVVVGGVGIYNIFYWNPKILCTISPYYIYRFARNFNATGWSSLGSIVLCVAGTEAMFADLGHFSKKSIKITFCWLIYPVLIVCYAGQAAFISKNWHMSKDTVQLSESVPGPLRHAFIVFSLSYCDHCRKPSNHHHLFFHHKPVPRTQLFPQS